jgi:pimeloyl-ACP methyl ester carboxylesterase
MVTAAEPPGPQPAPVRLHTREWGTGDRVAVLLHGRLGSAGCWWQVGPALAERGYRAIGVDLPGHGGSPRCPDATLDLVVDLVLEAVPAGPELAVGHSLGGAVLAAAVPRLRPRHAVYVDSPFVSSFGGFDRTELAAHFRRAKAARTEPELRRRRPWWSPQDVAVEVAAGEAFDVDTSVSLALSARGRDVTPPPGLSGLLVLADPDSCLVPPEEVARARRRGMDVVTIPGSGHSVWYGHVEEFMAALDAWTG